MADTKTTEHPLTVGLMLCDQVIVDKDTQKPSPIGVFTGLGVDDFAEPQRFSVFAVLTNGHGSRELDLSFLELETGEEIYRQVFPIEFNDPLQVVNINIRLRRIVFPAEGWYNALMNIDETPIAQRRFRVYQIYT